MLAVGEELMVDESEREGNGLEGEEKEEKSRGLMEGERGKKKTPEDELVVVVEDNRSTSRWGRGSIGRT